LVNEISKLKKDKFEKENSLNDAEIGLKQSTKYGFETKNFKYEIVENKNDIALIEEKLEIKLDNLTKIENDQNINTKSIHPKISVLENEINFINNNNNEILKTIFTQEEMVLKKENEIEDKMAQH